MLSIDPSSPFTQGAVLGDRIRLSDHFLDPGVFIRSMATRGSLGGLAEAALQAALLMDAAGKDDVLLETVGVGQGEIDIVDHADTIVLALMPGLGRLDPGAEGRGDGDPGRDRRQQVRPPARRHDDPRGQGGARARPRPPAGRCRWCAPRRPRARGSTSWSRRSTPTARTSPRPGRWSERRARNLRAEVLGIAACADAPRARAARARATPRLGGAARARRPPRDRPGDRRAQSCSTRPAMTDAPIRLRARALGDDPWLGRRPAGRARRRPGREDRRRDGRRAQRRARVAARPDGALRAPHPGPEP